jgi:hypothetical protein
MNSSFPDEYILHKVKMMTHEFRASLASMASTLKLRYEPKDNGSNFVVTLPEN